MSSAEGSHESGYGRKGGVAESLFSHFETLLGVALHVIFSPLNSTAIPNGASYASRDACMYAIEHV